MDIIPINKKESNYYFLMDPARIYICCNACKRRELDSFWVKKYLQKNGYTIVDNPHDANIIFFFTCSFSEEMSWDSCRKLHFFQENYNYVFVFGCFPIIGMHNLNLSKNVVVINNEALQDIEMYFPPSKLQLKYIQDGNDIYYDTIFKSDIFLIRISKGCSGNCSYCAIKKVIGHHKSKAISTIIEELKKALKQNFSYIRLVADDGGGYGIDCQLTIVKLLEQICTYTQIKGVDFEINPKWILGYRNEFYNFIKNHSNLLFKITIPIQSFSSNILRDMNRNLNVVEFIEFIKKIKEYNNNLYLTTHIIIGYPTEKQNDIDETLKHLISLRFQQINLFPCTLHPHSPIGQLYKSIDSVQKKINYVINKLCENGYTIIEASKSETNQWQHVIFNYTRQNSNC